MVRRGPVADDDRGAERRSPAWQRRKRRAGRGFRAVVRALPAATSLLAVAAAGGATAVVTAGRSVPAGVPAARPAASPRLPDATAALREATPKHVIPKHPIEKHAIAKHAAKMSAATIGAKAAAGGIRKPVKPVQRLVVLLGPHEAFSRPSSGSSRLRLLRERRPITGEQTVLPVVGRTVRSGAVWLRVVLPGRPNGLKGWIGGKATAAAMTDWHVVVETAARRVVVYRAGRAMRTFRAVVGKPATPTPHGTFFVEESVELPTTAVGGPYALALSARSNVLKRFDGGPGQIAVHGLENIGGVPGTAVSHGCVRLDDAALEWLVHRVGPGVPVTVR